MSSRILLRTSQGLKSRSGSMTCWNISIVFSLVKVYFSLFLLNFVFSLFCFVAISFLIPVQMVLVLSLQLSFQYPDDSFLNSGIFFDILILLFITLEFLLAKFDFSRCQRIPPRNEEIFRTSNFISL